jgi:tRNA A58 N-methylase Trm61
MTPLIVDSQKTYNNKFGTFKHKDMIGKEYGTKVSNFIMNILILYLFVKWFVSTDAFT